MSIPSMASVLPGALVVASLLSGCVAPAPKLLLPTGSAVVPPPSDASMTPSTASSDASTTPSERPEAGVDARPDQAAPSVAQRLRWGSQPDPKSVFAAVFDGYCAQMQVGPMPGPPVIAWGEHGVSVVRLEGDRVVDLSPRGAAFDLWDFRGIFGHSEGTILLGVSYGCCGGYEESYLLWTGSGWQSASASIKYPSGRFLLNEWGGHALHGDYDDTWRLASRQR